MGLDTVGYQTCQLIAATHGGMGSTLTLGRQSMNLMPSDLRRFGLSEDVLRQQYCDESLWQRLGATQCESVDFSDYEGASYTHDFNMPLPQSLKDAYDTVLDFGTLEHVFDVRTAFDNANQACRVGGVVAHVLPANQQCGHGFYQFSPEFFFSMYSHANGYDALQVFVVMVNSPDTWYAVARPEGGKRVNVQSASALVVVSIARRNSAATVSNLQQSDYVTTWTADPSDDSDQGSPDRDAPSSARSDSRMARMIGTLKSQESLRKVAVAARAAVHPVRSDGGLTPHDFGSLLKSAG